MMKWKEWRFKSGIPISKNESNIKQDRPKSGNLTRTGECNHCGKCCKPPVMLENPMIARSEDRCKFYVEEVNDKLYGHCKIYQKGIKLIKTVKDRFGKIITDEQIKWFHENCIEYPRVKDAEAGHMPPEGCGFSFEEQI